MGNCKMQVKQLQHEQVLVQMLHAAMQVSNPFVRQPVTVPQAQKRKVGVASEDVYTVTQDAPKKPRMR